MAIPPSIIWLEKWSKTGQRIAEIKGHEYLGIIYHGRMNNKLKDIASKKESLFHELIYS